jgi:UDP-glucose 4-epimerase
MSKKYVVTGGAGFIGSHLVERLLSEGHKVVVIDDLSSGFVEYLPDDPNVELVQVDISNWSALAKSFMHWKDAEGVFHHAACSRIQPSLYQPNLTNDVNVTGTLHVLQMMRMVGIDKIVYAASSSTYGLKNEPPLHEDMLPDTLNPYAATKLMGEIYCKTWGNLFGIKNICLKYFNVYGRRSPVSGPYAPVVGLFFRQAIKDKKKLTVVGDGEQRRDFTHIGDVVEANMLAMHKMGDGLSGETINIGTGMNHSINDIANMVLVALKQYGRASGVEHVHPRSGEARVTLADNSKAQQLL